MPPYPKDPAQRRRRNKPEERRSLPAGGRQGKAPAWPIDGEPSPAAAKLWAGLWSTPQAVAWEELEWSRFVARYVLIVLAAESGESKAWPEARQMEDRLGLTPMAMLRLRWQIGEPAEAPKLAEVVTPDRWRRTGTA
jgi:hypothetical protein